MTLNLGSSVLGGNSFTSVFGTELTKGRKLSSFSNFIALCFENILYIKGIISTFLHFQSFFTFLKSVKSKDHCEEFLAAESEEVGKFLTDIFLRENVF